MERLVRLSAAILAVRTDLTSWDCMIVGWYICMPSDNPKDGPLGRFVKFSDLCKPSPYRALRAALELRELRPQARPEHNTTTLHLGMQWEGRWLGAGTTVSDSVVEGFKISNRP